ncbi:hypothetical protein WG936_08200 [Corynebacterium sp. H127]|uniref:hypothetical protein n=1 Tax=Corynebacterium sp. H127 TaxID=3133418 RepID=UPI0030AB14FB
MPRPRLMLDSKKLGKLLVNNYADDIAALTDQVAKQLPDDVKVLTMTGINRAGRPYGLVTIAEPEALAMQAKHGVLSKSAARCGLDIKRREVE